MRCSFQHFTIHTAKLYLFHIQHSIQELLGCIHHDLPELFFQTKAEKHQKQFLAKQIILEQTGLMDQFYYNEKRKPFLKDGRYISISHSNHWVLVAVADKPIGIDIEQPAEKLLKLRSKFVKESEIDLFPQKNISALQYIWTAKESIYKIVGEAALHFKKGISLTQMDIKKNYGEAIVHATNTKIQLFYKKTIDNYLICCGFIKT